MPEDWGPPPVSPPRARATDEVPARRGRHPGASDLAREDRLTWMAVAAMVAAAILGLIAYAVVVGSSDDGSPEPTTPEATSPGPVVETDVDGSETIQSTAADQTAVAASGAFVEATLAGDEVIVLGVVPTDDLAQRLRLAAEVAYSPFVRWRLDVNASVGPADWLDRSPQTIVLLQTMTEGVVRLADGEVEVTGTAPSAEALDRLQRAVGQASGLPVDATEVEISDRKDPIYVIAAGGGRAALSGILPSEEIRQGLVGAAIDIYGDDNVVDATTVDPDVYPVLWMYNGGPLTAALSAFSDYEIRLDGRLFSGRLSGAALFGTDSAEISPAFGQVLDFGVGVMTRDPFIRAVVEGHTDDRGDSAHNLRLSQDRAEAVVEYVTRRGIDPGRLAAVGRGGAEPIDTNDTAEGRARNQRVEITLEISE